ncbi:uracil-DNA glycosylase family protein [uncultured Roseobacter sp.]|uniref:uracil-DNA glycosylase family protein n=1 Tax=uncultured Roseobacter sp. TaxID=114847 RepID=UPI0026217398|nr:uracil-DNA glycosylase family protein [uncultured Roseobacter sp.]
MLSAETTTRLITVRRAFARPGLTTYAEVGLDGHYITPYHLTCGNPAGPVLISYNYLDAPTARAHCTILRRHGYLADMLFNRVLDAALGEAQLTRADIYLTHAVHLLPETRSAAIPQADIDASFDAITQAEIAGRPVIALGTAAARACIRFGVPHLATAHPSARGQTADAKAGAIARALTEVTSHAH